MNKNINFKDLKTGENIDKIIKKRKYLPSLTLFINILLKKGLKLKNFLLFFKLLVLIKLRLLEIRKIKRKKPILFFFKVLKKVSIPTKIHTLNSGGKIYYIPIPITSLKRKFITIKELIKNSKIRLESSFILKLLGELNDSFFKKSITFKYKREQFNFAFENKQYFRFLIRYQPQKIKKKNKKINTRYRYIWIWPIRRNLVRKYESFICKSKLKRTYLINRMLLKPYKEKLYKEKLYKEKLKKKNGIFIQKKIN